MTQYLSTKVHTHVIITYTKSHHFITAGQQAALVDLSSDQFIEIDGNKIRGSSIAEVITVEKYRETYPDKTTQDAYQKYSPAPQSFEDIVSKYAWAATAYKFPDMMTLVALTHKKLDAWTGTFEDFCIKHKALTPGGGVIPAKYTDDKGNQHSAVFAYPFFMDVKSLIDGRKAKARYAQERSWEEIEQGRLDDIPVDNRVFTEKMGEWYDKHPEKKGGAGYKFFTEHLQSKYKKAQRYEPKFQTLEEYNSRDLPTA